ncbi:MAG: hypothetical protein SFV52_04150 [Saprospiraceae bacterium]|nr:hypothetical protein [Saprospiraceae bacterium]
MFGFKQYVHEVRKNQQAKNEQVGHGQSDFFKQINGFEKQTEAQQPGGKEENGRYHVVRGLVNVVFFTPKECHLCGHAEDVHHNLFLFNHLREKMTEMDNGKAGPK